MHRYKFVKYFSILLISTLSLAGCENTPPHSSSTPHSKADETTNASENALPENAINYLVDNFPGWAIPDTSDYEKSWWSFYEKKQIPYYVAADINDDQALDYAFIIKHAESIRLLILLDSAGTFTHRIAEDFNEKFTGKDIQFGLMIEPPKRIDVITNDKSLILKSNGISLMNFENRQQVYYWENGTLKSFSTDDAVINK